MSGRFAVASFVGSVLLSLVACVGDDPSSGTTTPGSDGGADGTNGTGGLGASCTATTPCTTGVCVDGICCDAACTGTCEACSAQGHCEAITGAPKHGKCDGDETGPCTGSCDGKEH